ncbi:neutral protease [Venturia nashicola]|uniref:Neutral protease 2 n=1 Tax=Venturia nashicola TaxID=86259 RepID=A0A4Z1NV43_9PEZI|nr:neutral protease [Venturia nashicola]
MRFTSQIAIASLAALVSSKAIKLEKRAPALDVKLSPQGNSVVKAVMTNTGASDINLLNKGTFLDKAAVEKVTVSSDAGAVPFLGLRKRVSSTGLTADAFTPLAAGQTIEFDVDMATVHDLSSGGIFKVTSYGAIPYTEANSTDFAMGQALVYNSNQLEVTVDGKQASKVKRALPTLDKRTVVQSDCTGTKRTNTLSALSNCKQLATAASTAAKSGSASKFQEYFKSTSTSVRNTVSARLAAVATECGSSTSGKTTQYCTDVYSACDSNTLAYTIPSQNLVVNCNIYFSALPVLSNTCHAQDMTTTTIHEFTHAPGVYSPGTEDNGYGYAAATSLSSANAVLNADSYALYSNGVYNDDDDDAIVEHLLSYVVDTNGPSP